MSIVYEKPMIFVNDDLSEGVYMASGAGCYTAWGNIHQTPEIGRGTYVIQLDGLHNAGDGLHSK